MDILNMPAATPTIALHLASILWSTTQDDLNAGIIAFTTIPSAKIMFLTKASTAQKEQLKEILPKKDITKQG